MRNVKISACQLKLKPLTNFEEFASQVKSMINQVPEESDYVIFPELVTLGLLNSFPNSDQFEASDLVRVSEYTDDYKNLFRNLAIQRKQVIIAGSHLERREDKYFNICYVFDKDGRNIEHKKTHIFPAEADWQTSEGNELEVYDIGPAKIGIAICYEAEIPEISRILSLKGAEIIFCPSYTFSEAGFWRVRHCAQARSIENQVYFVHCPTVGDPAIPVSAAGYGRASILSPCDLAFPYNGVVTEAGTNQNTVITGTVDIDELYKNRKSGAATTFYDRTRRESMYAKYPPFQTAVKQ
ncbi:nitrilase-related carbon-nitrogen hydrolase [Domibacillus epiphyticus]|uniref:Amidohydrolase n=1 Tax=Domibacillus epiphyticus TaxID=1714355 RepID=A0A1V2A4F6_9BACI|nr:nitrilase-related carbon-nitrogen hydrolase [Domibacillus epiphyticus]OMP65742.1 amidohydrolase [Domibacillus epiphyticus]